MLETEYTRFGANTMPADALAPKVARASTDMDGIGCVGQTTCSELILCSWVKPNPRYDSKCEYIFVVFKTIRHVKS